MSKRSLSERLEFIIEDDGACATCSGGGGSEGDGEGFGAGGEADKESDFTQLVKGLKLIKKMKLKNTKNKE